MEQYVSLLECIVKAESPMAKKGISVDRLKAISRFVLDIIKRLKKFVNEEEVFVFCLANVFVLLKIFFLFPYFAHSQV